MSMIHVDKVGLNGPSELSERERETIIMIKATTDGNSKHKRKEKGKKLAFLFSFVTNFYLFIYFFVVLQQKAFGMVEKLARCFSHQFPCFFHHAKHPFSFLQ